VFPLPLPPLRDRDTDVELLAQHFLDELNAQTGTTKTLSAAARQFLFQYAWPGNVRELRNAVQRAFIMGNAEVNFDLSAVPSRQPAATAIAEGVPLPAAAAVRNGMNLQFAVGTPLETMEREMIMATLEHCRGHKRETAEMLGVSLKTLYNRLNEYRAKAAAPAADGSVAAPV
jgi:DNA-binding NtrC family response regulator